MEDCTIILSAAIEHAFKKKSPAFCTVMFAMWKVAVRIFHAKIMLRLVRECVFLLSFSFSFQTVAELLFRLHCGRIRF